MKTATLSALDFSDLRLETIRVLDVRGVSGASDFAASSGKNCNVPTACSCSTPKAVDSTLA
jgi:hypothetical protein